MRWVSKRPLLAALLLLVLLFGAAFLNRILSVFDLEVTPTPPYIGVSRESFLAFEVSPKWHSSPGGVLLAFRRPKKSGYDFEFPEVTVKVKYPHDRPLKVYFLNVGFLYENRNGGLTDIGVRCVNLPKFPRDLLNERIEIDCKIDWLPDAAVEPLNEDELSSAMGDLPGWGKGWVKLRNTAVRVSYQSAAKDNVIVSFRIPVLQPGPLSPGECRHGLVLPDVAAQLKSRIKTKADAHKLLGSPYKVESSLHPSFRGYENWRYRCSDLNPADVPTCMIAIGFNPHGRQTGVGYAPTDEIELDGAIRRFEEILATVRDQSDALRQLGKPHLRLKDSWFYRLPEGPENVLFELKVSEGTVNSKPIFRRDLPWIHRLPC